MIGGKWKSNILYNLGNFSTLRFGEFKKKMPDVSEKMLIQQLRELEKDGMVKRKVYRQVPPKVEYSLTELGSSLFPILLTLRDWGAHYEKESGLYKFFKDSDQFEKPYDFLQKPRISTTGKNMTNKADKHQL
ncbi:MAG: transcriptional regulator [Deltaproteobacteria bacterium]|nr:MAG: transcriptional regulator [Deltaproteobacteria bacterium]PIE72994.1 MAG: transcriptional regulator [Deltaproteobacteria bacterium]